MTPLISQKAGALAQTVADEAKRLPDVETALKELQAALELGDKPLRDALLKTVLGLKVRIGPNRPLPGPKECQPPHLYWMLCHIQWEIETMPVDKISRWIGFVQGVLTMHHLVHVASERDRTRPSFHEAYEQLGYRIMPPANGPSTTDSKAYDTNHRTNVLRLGVNGKTMLVKDGDWLSREDIIKFIYGEREGDYKVSVPKADGMETLGPRDLFRPVEGMLVECVQRFG